MKYKYLIIFSMVALTAFFCSTTGFASILGSADSFAVLAGSTVTNTGNTTINGDIGVWAGTAYTGYGTVTQTGSQHLDDAVAQTAQGDLTTAYNGLAGMPVNTVLTGQNLAGLILTPGVYKYSSDALLSGTLLLDAQGKNNAYWVFQIGTGLTTAPNSAVQFINLGSNSGSDNGVFWQVGSAATLDTGTAFEGNILADQMIALNTGATLNGRALARIDKVTMQGNTINTGLNGGLRFEGNTIIPFGPSGPSTVPEPATLSLISLGLIGLIFKKRKIV